MIGGKSVNEADYGCPTLDMCIDGMEFSNKCADSFEAGSTWVKSEK
ncbi:MAG: hypothetical protein RR234_05935 [Christensenella sp.]